MDFKIFWNIFLCSSSSTQKSMKVVCFGFCQVFVFVQGFDRVKKKSKTIYNFVRFWPFLPSFHKFLQSFCQVFLTELYGMFIIKNPFYFVQQLVFGAVLHLTGSCIHMLTRFSNNTTNTHYIHHKTPAVASAHRGRYLWKRRAAARAVLLFTLNACEQG